jgi:hypothetical protein
MFMTMNGECRPSETDWAIRMYLENDETWDVDVYEGDERDNEFSRGYLSLQEAYEHTMRTLQELMIRGTVALDLDLHLNLRYKEGA